MSASGNPDIRAGRTGHPYVFPWGKIFGEKEQLKRETQWLDHHHPAHELLWNQIGATTVVVDRCVWTVAGPQGLWLPAGTVHSGSASAGVTYRATYFDAEHSRAIFALPVAVAITPLLAQLLDHIENESLGESERSRAEAVVMDLLKPISHAVVLRMPSHGLISTAAEEILADPSEPHSADSWAKRLEVSSRTITRTFRSETGVGFAQWVAMARARRAVELLASGLSVAETAERVGYAATSAFGVAFRRVTGLTPGAFRSDE